MNALDRAIMALAPEAGLRRLRARAAAQIQMNYDAATGGRRGKSWRTSASDADSASKQRARLAYVSRDLIRNTPFAGRARDVIVNNVVGDGIIPSFDGMSEAKKRRGLELVKAHFDTTAIDYYGRQNLYGLERLLMSTVVESGEALIRVHGRRVPGSPIPMQIQIMEPDWIDAGMDGIRPNKEGGFVHEGIEYDRAGRRVAYWLYNEHPGSDRPLFPPRSERIPAEEIRHIYRQDRPGQQRGVSWFAPVALTLQDLRDYADAQLMRQKIAACFAAFRRTPDAEGDDVTGSVPSSLAPGGIWTLGPGEDIAFANPPVVTADAFVQDCLREIAAGLGITFEALTGNLGNVNFSSGRMGRIEMERSVSSWQWLLMVPQALDWIAEEFLQAWRLIDGPAGLQNARVVWTPPARVIIDPAKEIGARKDMIRAGLTSWQREVRALGYDPETIAAEIAEDGATFDRLGLVVESDARQDAAPAATEPQPQEIEGQQNG